MRVPGAAGGAVEQRVEEGRDDGERLVQGAGDGQEGALRLSGVPALPQPAVR